jgi:hypothetical protein
MKRRMFLTRNTKNTKIFLITVNSVAMFWRDARVVESGGLEIRCAFIGTEGSNPSFSG